MEPLFDQTCKARDSLYSNLGVVEPDVIAHLINPAFMGGPAWPALRQAFSVIRADGRTIVASNGLSDPFDDVEEANTGFGLEIYAETESDIEGNIVNSALFKLVYAVAQQAAHAGQMAEFVRKHEVITMELCAEDCGLQAFQNENGSVGIMIGIQHPDRPKYCSFPGGEMVLASVQVLTPDELEYVSATRAEGRNRLHDLMQASGTYHFVSPDRRSLIDSSGAQPENTSPASTFSAKMKPWWKIW